MPLGGMTLTWVLIAALSLAVDGTLFGWLWNASKADCYKKNLELLENHKQGPLRDC